MVAAAIHGNGPITLLACQPPLSPGLTLHAPFVGGDKIVPIIQGWAGGYLSQLRDLLRDFFIKLSIQLHQKRSIQDLGSHRPPGPSIIIMGGLASSLWCARARGKSYRDTQVGQADSGKTCRRAGEQILAGQAGDLIQVGPSGKSRGNKQMTRH